MRMHFKGHSEQEKFKDKIKKQTKNLRLRHFLFSFLLMFLDQIPTRIHRGNSMKFSKYFVLVVVMSLSFDFFSGKALGQNVDQKRLSDCEGQGNKTDDCLRWLSVEQYSAPDSAASAANSSTSPVAQPQASPPLQAPTANPNISECGKLRGLQKTNCEKDQNKIEQTRADAGTDGGAGVQACQEKTEQAVKSCDPSSSSSYSMGVNFLDQATTMTQQINNQVGGACNAVAKYVMGAQGSMAAYQLWCAGGFKRCSNTCEAEIKKWTELSRSPHPETKQIAQDQLTRLKPEMEKCNKQQVFSQNAMKNVMQMGYQVFQLSMCQKAAKSADCSKNPNEPICQIGKLVDCSDPAAATSNLTCVCAANPNDGRCTGVQYAGANGRKGGGFDSSSSGLDEGLGKVADFHGGLGDSGSEGFNDSSASKGNGVAMGGGPTGGGGGGGFGSGGGGGAPARGQQQGAQRGNTGFNTNINSGFNSGSGSGGSRSSSGGWVEGSNSRGNGFGGAALPQDNKKLVDLKKYMPGGSLDPSRVLASMDKDGLTGPNTNIWNKVNLRYLNLQATLRP